MLNFFKSIIVGVGGIAPGLSGSVMLVIFGLYERVINAVATLFKNLRKNLSLLIPVILGFGVGILLFSKAVDFFLDTFPMQTRYLFLGLVIGTLPLFYREVEKNGFNSRYYYVIAISLLLGFALMTFSRDLFPRVEEPNFLQSLLLGVAVAGSSIVPGIDSAVILSALGLYELYVDSVANLNFTVLLPALIGLALGAVVISFIMNFLIKRFYTLTFSVIFGLFVSIIPSVLTDECVPRVDLGTVISFILVPLGFAISFYLGDVKGNNKAIRKLLGKNGEEAEIPENAIDIISNSTDPISAALSNFASHPFVIDGVSCGGMEGFLQSLKCLNKKDQIRVAALCGKDAKEEGMDRDLWRITGKVYWQGRFIKRNSEEFDALISRAYDAMYNENEGFREALKASAGRPLVHTVGKHGKLSTLLTEKEFIKNLTRLRDL